MLFVHETRQDALSGGIDVEVTALVLLVNWNLTLLIYKPAHDRRIAFQLVNVGNSQRGKRGYLKRF